MIIDNPYDENDERLDTTNVCEKRDEAIEQASQLGHTTSSIKIKQQKQFPNKHKKVKQ